jgi:hypothetical protein
MKAIFAALSICAFAQGALAKEVSCRSIEGTNARLACYDAAYPPRPTKPAAIESDASRADYKDPFSAEDARTNAKLKNICRGC